MAKYLDYEGLQELVSKLKVYVDVDIESISNDEIDSLFDKVFN